MLKSFIKYLIEKNNLFITRAADTKRIQELIVKLHPVVTEKELIRLGNNGDGGYLVPNDLAEIEACFSPGVDVVSDFEKACYEKGMKIFMADKTIEKPTTDIPENSYSFIKKHIGCTTNEAFITLDDWVNENLSTQSDIILQMDIEGAEYNTLINASDDLLKRCRIMVIEFHDLFQIWNPVFFETLETVINKILQTHTCVHIHPNNFFGTQKRFGIEVPLILEFTFYRNDRFTTKTYATQFPHPLDCDNTNHTPIVLPKNWYKS